VLFLKTIAIVQARTGSTRLPSKVLLPLGEKFSIQWVIDRIKKCKEIDSVLLATTTHKSDDALESLCKDMGIVCFRGSENDVLDRYYSTAKFFNLGSNDIVVRITGDCPLIDPEICGNVISLIKSKDLDYVSNTVTCTFPDGLDCEAMKFGTLEKSWQQAKLKYEREHVTQYILRHPELFKIGNYTHVEDLSALRWTLDTPEDYQFIKAVIEGIGNEHFDMKDILNFLEKHPELHNINSSIIRNEGLIKSMQEENP